MSCFHVCGSDVMLFVAHGLAQRAGLTIESFSEVLLRKILP